MGSLMLFPVCGRGSCGVLYESNSPVKYGFRWDAGPRLGTASLSKNARSNLEPTSAQWRVNRRQHRKDNPSRGGRAGIHGISDPARFCLDHRTRGFPLERVNMGRFWKMELAVPRG